MIRFPRFCWALQALVFVSLSSASFANPSGESVAAGRASFERSGVDFKVSTSSRSIINWQDFSIQAGETTQFLQPSASSVSLNRVVSGNPSLIYGNLQANGQIYLINPNGVLVGQSGRIDTAGFLASTLNVADKDFLSGKTLHFFGSSDAAIANHGSISTGNGDVILIGRNIENTGNITGNSIHLAAGDDILVKPSGSERVLIRPGKSAKSAKLDKVHSDLNNSGSAYSLAINNSGVVQAAGAIKSGGRVFLTSSRGSITNSGQIAARTRGGAGGQIRIDAGKGGLVTNSGKVNASGVKGGSIELTAGKVEISAGEITASGENGGGTVLVGGDYQGKGKLAHAETTHVGSAATISADALAKGNGGKVVLWSDRATSFEGTITARGAGKGNGGLVEVSSADHLDFRGRADLRAAPGGKLGTLLLDPRNLSIVAGGNITDEAADEFSDSSNLDRVIDPLTLDATGANVVLQANNDVFVHSALSLTTPDASLTIQAGRSIFINNDISTTNGGITLIANETAANGVVDAQRAAGAAEIKMAVGTTIESGGADILLKVSTGAGLMNSASGNITVETVDALDGNVALVNNGLSANSGIAMASTAGGISGVSLSTDANGSVNVRTMVDALNGASVSGSLTVDNGSLDIVIGGAVTATGVNLSAGTGTLNIEAPITAGSGAVSLTAGKLSIEDTISGTGSLTLQPFSPGTVIGINQTTGGFDLDSTELANLAGQFSSITIGRADGTGTMRVDSASFSDPVTLRVPGGTLEITDSLSGFGDAAFTLSAKNIQFRGAAPSITTQSGAISITGAVKLFGDTTLDTSAGGGGNITLHGTLNGGFDFTGNAGSGNVRFIGLNAGASVGGLEKLASISLSGATLDLNPGTVTTGDQSYHATTLALVNGSRWTSGGDITFSGSGVVQPTRSLDFITNGGDIIFNSMASVAIPGTSIRLDPGNTGSVTFGAAVNLPVLNVTRANQVAFLSTVTVPRLSIAAREINFNGGAGAVSGDHLVLQPLLASQKINIGGADTALADTLDLTGTDIAALSSDFETIKIGRSTGTGLITVELVTLYSPATIQALSGAIEVNGKITGADDASITLKSSAIWLGADIETMGNAIALQGATVLKNNITLTTHGLGNITFSSSLNDTAAGAHTLSLDANDISFLGAVGTKLALGAVTANGAGVTLVANAFRAASLATDAPGSTHLKGWITTTAAAGQRFNDPMQVIGISTLTANNAGDIHFANTVDGKLGASGLLTISAPLGDIIFDQAVGSITPLTGLTITNGEDAHFLSSLAAKSISVKSAIIAVDDAVTSTGAQSYRGAVTLGGAVTASALTINATADVSNSAPWSVTGLTRISAPGFSVDLLGAGNQLRSLGFTAANVSVQNDAPTTNLTASSIGDQLLINTSGAITNSSGLVVGGDATFVSTSSGAAITLNSGGNRFKGTLRLTTLGAGSASIVNGAQTHFYSTTVGGNLSVTSAGVIDQIGALNVDGEASFSASKSNITLSHSGNNFGSLRVNGVNVSVLENSSTDLGASTVRGELNLTSHGDITSHGAISVAGISRFTSTLAGAEIRLDNPANNLVGKTFFSTSGDALLTNTPAIQLGIITVSGDFTAMSAGSGKAINSTSSSGALNIGGVATFTATRSGAAISLQNSANVFNQLAFNTVGAGSVTAVNSAATGTVLTNSTVGASLTLQTAGNLTQLSAIEVGGTLAITAGGSITLDNALNEIAALGATSRRGAFTLNNTGALVISGAQKDLGTIASDITIATTGGNLSIAGPTGSKIFGRNITLATNANFLNSAGSAALATSNGGRYLIYSISPSDNTIGGLAFDFEEFNKVYPATPEFTNTGDGFIYSASE